MNVLRCLLRQVAVTEMTQGVSPAVLKILHDRKQTGKSKVESQLTLDECIDALTSIVRDLEYLYVVIDALDEFSGDERQAILDALEQLTDKNGFHVKVFVSSREAQDLVHRLKGRPNIMINAKENSADISHYVTVQLDRAIRNGRLCGHVSAELRAHIIERLCQKANGMWVDDVPQILLLD